MNITDVDIQLLHYLHAVKVATYKQIHRDIYPKHQLRSVCNRLAKLEREHLITGTQNRMLACGEKIVSVSKQGYQKHVACDGESRCELRSEAVVHDLKLVDVRHRLLSLANFSDYLTENQVQTWGIGSDGVEGIRIVKLNSDAVVKVQFPAATVLAAVEYEDSDKAAQRYDPIVKKYYHSEDIGIVLYVCKSDSLVRKIAEIEKSLFQSDQPKFFYAQIHTLLQGDEVTFRNCNGYQLKFAARIPGEQVMNS